MTAFAPRTLDENGRCCGRKPLRYQTAHDLQRAKDPHHFCGTCNAEFGLDGKQRANWAWNVADGGFLPSNTAGGNFKLEDWTEFFAIEPARRQRWRSERQQEIYRRLA